MTEFSQVMQELCANLGLPAEPEADLLVLEIPGHQAVVSSCKWPSGDEGLCLQISAGTLPRAGDGSLVDSLRLLHHLNHEARTLTPWRIVLSEDDVLMIQQTCLLSVGMDHLQQLLIDGLERVDQLQILLQEWLPEPEAGEVFPTAGPSAHIIFG